jgi:hypothetical protein
MKCRFIEEYANFQRKQIKTNSWLSASENAILLEEIDDIVKMTRRGYITVNECMKRLANIEY